MRDLWYTARFLVGVSPERLAADYERRKQKKSGTALILLARFPRPGHAKTRLAASLGEEQATRLYRLCADHAFNESGRLSSHIERYIFYADEVDRKLMQRWAGRGFRYVAQREGDLGQRLEHACCTVLSHGAQKAIAVATDVPDLSATIIDEAIAALDACDVVMGPSHDGGYYLIGMRKLHHQLLSGIPWSTDTVLQRTLSIAESSGFKTYLLPSLIDIDTEEDIRRWYQETSPNGRNRPIRDFIECLGQ
jgi:hypothetical protein